jgi:TPR repeat protein
MSHQIVIRADEGGQTAFYGTVYNQNGGGSLDILRFGGWGDFYYPFLQFDVSHGPDASATRKATLKLYVVGDSPPNDPHLAIDRVLQSWDAGSVSYDHHPDFDYYQQVTALQRQGNSMDITDLYKGWRSGTIPNYGICLVSGANNQTNGAFASSRATDVNLRPAIIVDTIPAADSDDAHQASLSTADRLNREAAQSPGDALRVALAYRDGTEGADKDYAKAMIYFRKAADAGDATAMFNIGVLYQYGRGVDQDYQQAMAFYRKAADAGNAEAMRNLGFLYASGCGVTQDYQQAMVWDRKAADAGDTLAMKNIGIMYASGQGMARDYQQAMAWYRKAADAGDAGAMEGIGFMYDHGQGVARDFRQAMAWYRKAADAGNAGAMNNIGVMYQYGHGVAWDYQQAVAWYRKAAALGDMEAKKRLAGLGAQ